MAPVFRKVRFPGAPLCAVTEAELTRWMVEEGLRRETPARISYLNAATTNLAVEDPDQARRLREFEAVYADGKAVVWAARLLGDPIPCRVNAGDFTEAFFRAFAGAGLKVALVGGEPGVAERFGEVYRARAPGLRLVFVNDGFFENETGVREALEARDPDVVLLGMGSPRQERIAEEWSRSGRPRVWWCVGALFEYDAGVRRRAPVWMRRVGLEWAFRLAMEPGRLWRRYLIGNPKFVWRTLKAKLAQNARAKR